MKKYFLLLLLAVSFNQIVAMDSDDEKSWVLDFDMSNPELKSQVQQLMPAQDFDPSQQKYVYERAEDLSTQLDEELARPSSPFARWKEAGLTKEQILARFVVETAQSMRPSDHMPFVSPSFRHPELYPELGYGRLLTAK